MPRPVVVLALLCEFRVAYDASADTLLASGDTRVTRRETDVRDKIRHYNKVPQNKGHYRGAGTARATGSAPQTAI